jgi:hypothetical protein
MCVQGLDLPDVASDVTFQGLVSASDLPSLPASIAPSFFISQQQQQQPQQVLPPNLLRALSPCVICHDPKAPTM